MALKKMQRRFVDEYLIDLNATQAAIRAGYSPKTAQEQSSRLLSNVMVAEAIQAAMAARSKRTQIDADDVLRQWWELANVDVNELVEYRRDNCRHCWGIDHEYQWTRAEYERDVMDADDNGKEQPSCAGGFGFVPTREPNPECPECAGEGRGKIHVHDTRRLKGAARLLYAGVQQGKDGLKVMIDDRMKARENVGRHLGMFNDRRDDELKKLAAEKARLEIERMRLENEKLRKEIESGDDTPPTPVKVVVEVKDARKRDA
ncbi:TPA: terminase small subunit [Burkholderia vietnamiensis]|nr:terminase small subunit [Burkholderia vietnamiensis]